MTKTTRTEALLSDEQIQAISIVADQRGNDRLFAACARAYTNRAARVELTRAYRAQLARGRS